jgi:hypothetical protein
MQNVRAVLDPCSTRNCPLSWFDTGGGYLIPGEYLLFESSVR